MADREPDPLDLPEAVTEPRRRMLPGVVWIIPLIAVLVGGWLAVKAVLEKGPTITITFKTAEGLEPGKTKIKYKDVEIGLIKTITLNRDHKSVVLTAELSKEAEAFLVADTRFWVVRPRIGLGGVSGLGTLLSGAYIGLDVGHSKESQHAFVGLEDPPLVTGEDPGRHFVLHAQDLGSLDLTSPVYFRRVQVGEVVARQLDPDSKGVTLKVFIRAPYDQYVNEYTRFWNASGIDVSLSASGVEVRTESVISLLVGGIAFQTLPDAPPAPPAEENVAFTLFGDQAQAFKRPDALADAYVLIFQESVRGLSVGAPVDFRGVTVGEVVRFGVAIDPTTLHASMPVEIKIFPHRLAAHQLQFDRERMLQVLGSEEARHRRMAQFVANGLRGQLRSGNLLTGQLYVALDFFPDQPRARLDMTTTLPEIPTIPGTFAQLQDSLASVMKKLDKIQFEEIDSTARKALASLDQALKDADGLLKHVDTDVVPTLGKAVDDVRRALDEAGRTLKSTDSVLAPDSALQTQLRDALREAERTLRSVRELADYLERHPESLIRGKPAEEVK